MLPLENLRIKGLQIGIYQLQEEIQPLFTIIHAHQHSPHSCQATLSKMEEHRSTVDYLCTTMQILKTPKTDSPVSSFIA